ncbi:hypothetical protein COW36_20285 [bacterium (Candidatus Blackallbacteria) CG17_big_fil_post_rev_8_21_14_2_50_48_46]|uniref:Uncharacterized protein n=1 Tax=bacterium (Candidatus Blackallbacteria) CG17_big_fil_post_rev_8_21_14_2_50_48_46 TaxID=2014261 RepID=A0A2M7FZM4_9BACT|nr:MAG: hypothetical protein COW64_22610 [bacterium (Candidatus Blackallbacteria) CG18_big_fil_WC_8_21_14_2_50_49_26]PIW14745.1 MAG: hypothetical protein COW36_20285 [bacterium (Candidatus Blackallbacteria) CG17_big_fil_post_rev_8_21_14_2_50_48_46]PIW50847.1 MAG: hypothetical protein COW20_01100 [bacterium (Candidatus Blackallbacteria) CG13_big_fil_rev_8_21_14_2_50_49_14]
MTKQKILSLIVSGSLLCGCTPLVIQITNPSTQTSSTAVAAKSGAISGYLMKVSAVFKVQALDDQHTQLLQENVKGFESDLKSGKLDDYYRLPEFSVKLLAHSEGSYFTSPDNLNELSNTSASFARALVIYPDQSYDIFKGQFANQRFYFAGAETLPAENTSYLITLDNNFQTRVVTGQMEGQSESAEPLASAKPTALPSPEPLPLASPSPEASPNPAASPPPPAPEIFSQAVNLQRQKAEDYRKRIRNFAPAPPPPPPPGIRGQFPPPPPSQTGKPPVGGAVPPGGPPPLIPPEVMERLRLERPIVAAEIDALAGLPPQEHYARTLKIQEQNADLIPALGPPPPADAPGPQAQNSPPPRG